MGVLDKFLNAMKLNDEDYDDYDDDYFDEEDDYPEQPQKKKPAKQDLMNDDFAEPKKEKVSPKVTPMRTTGKVRSTASGMEVCVIKPTSVEDAREIIEIFLVNCIVVLNLEGLDVDIAQRIIDFTSGSTFAISGNLQKISHYIFIITPRSVDISGDFQEILSGAFDVPALNNRF